MMLQFHAHESHPDLLQLQKDGKTPFHRKTRVLKTAASHAGDANQTHEEQRNLFCVFHPETNHNTIDCRSFINLSDADKKSAMTKNHLCFTCSSKQHLARDCKANYKCTTCSQPHSSILHGTRRIPMIPRQPNPGPSNSNQEN